MPKLLIVEYYMRYGMSAYYLGGKKICNMNLVEAMKDDTLML